MFTTQDIQRLPANDDMGLIRKRAAECRRHPAAADGTIRARTTAGAN
jgi:hypothetical protein